MKKLFENLVKGVGWIIGGVICWFALGLIAWYFLIAWGWTTAAPMKFAKVWAVIGVLFLIYGIFSIVLEDNKKPDTGLERYKKRMERPQNRASSYSTDEREDEVTDRDYWGATNPPFLLEEVEDYSGADRKKTTDTKERYSAYFREKYDAYLLSREWKEKADICKLNAGYRCQLCNGEDRLVAHHKTYDRIFRELDTDLICLCTRCHEKHHTNDYSNMLAQ